ncbi:hypothetical protein [Cupriavidus sp. H18C1]
MQRRIAGALAMRGAIALGGRARRTDGALRQIGGRAPLQIGAVDQQRA